MPRQTSLTGLLRSGAGPLQSPGGGARADPVQADGPGVPAQARAGNMEHCTRASNEGFAKVREDFTITEKVPTSVFSWLA